MPCLAGTFPISTRPVASLGKLWISPTEHALHLAFLRDLKSTN